MSNPASASPRRDTQKIERQQWNAALAEFTRENRGAHGTLDVLGGEVGRQVETEDWPFQGISADTKAGEDTVWITFGSTPEDHLAHGVPGVTGIWIAVPTLATGAAVELESKDGTKTVLQLTLPEAYSLPGS